MRFIWLLATMALGAFFASQLATAALVDSGLVSDGHGGKVVRQLMGPNGKRSGTLPVGRTSKDLTGKGSWGVYVAGAGAKYRVMSTATVAGPQFSIPNGAWHERRVNPATPFLHYSTPTAGEYQEE